MIGQINLAVWALIEAFRGLRQARIWLPFVLMFALQGLLLTAFVQSYQPSLSWLMVPLMSMLGAPGTGVHYPELYAILPILYSRVNLAVDWILGTYLFGAAFLLVYRVAAGSETAGAWGRTWRVYPRLLVARLPVLAVLIFIYFGLPRVIGTEEAVRGNALRLARYGSFFAGVVGEGLFLFAPLAILVHDRSIGGAWRDTLGLAVRNPLAILLIILIPNLVQLPVSAVMRRTPQIVESLAPETVAWLLVLGAAVYILVNFIVISAAVRVFGARYRAAEGGASWAA